MIDQPVVEPSVWRRLRDGANSVVFVTLWLGVVNAQTMVVRQAANAAAQCSLPVGAWNIYTAENVAAAVIVIAAAGTSAYLVCAKRRDWSGTLTWSVVLCAILAAFFVLFASLSTSAALSESVVFPRMTIVANTITVVPGFAALNTLVVCRMLHRSKASPRAAAWRAGLVPTSWFVAASLVLLAATAGYCS